MQIRMLREIDALFEGVPQTRKTLEAKEEMLQNLMEKYNDLLAEGKSEEAAFNIALGSVGDISDLIAELQQPPPKVVSFPEPDLSDYEDEEVVYDYDVREPEAHARDRSARVVSLSIMLYILSPLAIIIFGGKFGLLLFFGIIAAATGLLVYNGMTSPKRPGILTPPDADGEAEPPQKAKMTKQQKKLLGSLSSALWLLVVAVYILVSFSTGAWHITWIIFLIAAALNNVLKAFIDLLRS